MTPTVCVDATGPTQTVDDKETGHGWPVSEYFHDECSELREKYGLAYSGRENLSEFVDSLFEI